MHHADFLQAFKDAQAQAATSEPRQATIDDLSVTGRKKKFQNLVLAFLIENNLAFNILDSESFSKLISFFSTSFHLPSAHRASELINEKYLDIKRLVKDDLFANATAGLAITADIWSDQAKDDFLGITAHFVDKEFCNKTVTLDVVDASFDHTGDKIATELERSVDYFAKRTTGTDLPIIGATTDGGSNMLKAISMIGYPSFKCIAHTIQRCLYPNMTGNGIITAILVKMRKLHSRIKRSAKATRTLFKLLEEAKKDRVKFLKDTEVRWSSTFNMIQRVRLIGRDVISRFVDDADLRKSKKFTHLEDINNDEWCIIEFLFSFLEPFAIVTNDIQASNFPTFSRSIQIINFLQHSVKNSRINKLPRFTGVSRTALDKFVKSVEDSLLEKFVALTELEDRDDVVSKTARLAAVLDPRVFPRISSTPYFNDTMTDLLREMRRVQLVNVPNSDANVVVSVESSSTNFSYLCNPGEVAIVSNAIENELREFRAEVGLSSVATPLHLSLWWKERTTKYPRISILARKYLCIPATSAASERVFSTGGLIVTSRRHHLNPGTVRALMFLKDKLVYFY